MTPQERAPGTSLRERRRTEPVPAAERMLWEVGVDPAFAEAVLGDLAEEYAERSMYGVGAARFWYVGQIIRSAPYLIRNAGRHAAGRTRLALVLASMAIVASAIMIALQARDGPPARLIAGTRDTVLVNFMRPVSLPMRVLDADGRILPDTGVRYAWVAGEPVSVSARGVVTCERPGDATVRAALGSIATNLLLQCRPVREVRGSYSADFVLGDSARDLDVVAVGMDGGLVTLLSAWLSVEDSTVAGLTGLRVHPRSPGETRVNLRVGDRTADFMVRVFELLPSLEGLRSDQRLVAAQVRLARGASVRWPLPTGRFYLSLVPKSDVKVAPTLAVDGAVMCSPALEPGVNDTCCVARLPGAWVTVENPPQAGATAAAPVLVGTLTLHRDREP